MNLFIEGIPGMGKSTLLNKMAMEHPEYQVYREGDYCPVELAWCACMTEEEYIAVCQKYSGIREEIEKWTVREHYDSGCGVAEKNIVPYTRIITDEPGFHKYMEQFEIYQGRKSAEEFRQIILMRYKAFAKSQSISAPEACEMQTKDNHPGKNGQQVTIMECSFFQNILEELMLFCECTDQEIFAFYQKLFEILRTTDFKLYYLYDEDVDKVLGHIARERSDARGNMLWYPMMLAYLQESPYGKKHAFKGMQDVVAHFKRRQKLELWIIREILGDRAQVIPAWQEAKR